MCLSSYKSIVFNEYNYIIVNYFSIKKFILSFIWILTYLGENLSIF